MTIFLAEFFHSDLDEVIVEIILDKIDCAASETAAHDS